MSNKRYWIGAVIVVAALGYLAFSGANNNMVTYLTISEVKANPEMSSGTGVRVVGNVASGTIEPRGGREVWFTVAAVYLVITVSLSVFVSYLEYRVRVRS